MTKVIDVSARASRAKELFLEGYNCSQAVALAYADIADVDAALLAKIAAPFGGGMGRLREVCGAVSGMTLLAGFISPNPKCDDAAAKRANYTLVQEFAEQFCNARSCIQFGFGNYAMNFIHNGLRSSISIRKYFANKFIIFV